VQQSTDRLVWDLLTCDQAVRAPRLDRDHTRRLKYGSPAPERPIEVDVTRLDGLLRVMVSDGGRGLPEDFDPRLSKGLGMQVVSLLVKQLHGALAIGRGAACGSSSRCRCPRRAIRIASRARPRRA
jgi:hypothetical protein